MSTTTELDHEKTFAAAWADPRYTRTERPPVDVNAVLAKHYRLSRPLTFTRTQLWDMEVRKAFRPDIYIPMATLEELDGNKKGMSEVARNARQASRFLDEIVSGSEHDIENGIELHAHNGGQVGRNLNVLLQ